MGESPGFQNNKGYTSDDPLFKEIQHNEGAA